MTLENQTDPRVNNVGELLNEAGRLVRSFFHRGVMTLQMAKSRWEEYHQTVAAAKDALWQPLFPAEASASPQLQPMVTVLQSQDPERFPVGARMTLAEADRGIRERDAALHQSEPDVGRALEVQIDYVMDGAADRYLASPTVGLGQGSLLQQIQNRILGDREGLRSGADLFGTVAPEFQGALREHFTPLLEQGLDTLSTRLMGFFQRHLEISTMERHFQDKAATLPESARKDYLSAARETVSALRRDAGSTLGAAPAEARTGPEREKGPSRGQGKPRSSVKITLRAIQEDHKAAPVRPRPSRARER